MFKITESVIIGHQRQPIIESKSGSKSVKIKHRQERRNIFEIKELEQNKMMNYNTNIQQQPIGRSSKYEVNYRETILVVVSMRANQNLSIST